MRFTVRVPATSANIGPGFDCLGIAWDMYAQFHFHTREGSDLMVLPLYRNAKEAGHRMNRQNLALDAYWMYAKSMHVALPSVGAHIVSDIPSTRGLGSSAACIVAGTMAARMLALRLSKEKLKNKFSVFSALRVSAEMEGHPDNVAPAFYGGLQISRLEKGKVQTASLPVSPLLRFHLLIPDFPMSTKKSRSILPNPVERADAVFNLSSLGFLIQGMRTGSGKLLRFALQDRLHEPYRRPTIAGADRWEKMAREAGAFGLVISGSGSTLLVVSHKQRSDRMGEMLQNQCPSAWKVREVHVDPRGVVVMNPSESLA